MRNYIQKTKSCTIIDVLHRNLGFQERSTKFVGFLFSKCNKFLTARHYICLLKIVSFEYVEFESSAFAFEISNFRRVEISSFRRVAISKQTNAKADDSNFDF